MTEATKTLRAVITVGVPACGKSTWAAGSGLFEINLDWCRFLVCGDAADQSSTGAALVLHHELILHAAACKKDIVVSDTNLNPKFRDLLIEKLQNLGYSVEIKVFDTPFRVCLERNAARDRKVPLAVMAKMEYSRLCQRL